MLPEIKISIARHPLSSLLFAAVTDASLLGPHAPYLTSTNVAHNTYRLVHSCHRYNNDRSRKSTLCLFGLPIRGATCGMVRPPRAIEHPFVFERAIGRHFHTRYDMTRDAKRVCRTSVGQYSRISRRSLYWDSLSHQRERDVSPSQQHTKAASPGCRPAASACVQQFGELRDSSSRVCGRNFTALWI
ncbi:hypothetical protein T440DRAFT_152973 [Plenodomus tracheiphilus IPT5]|uniref:Uncharacterized protein n=1 Tax=Plenodomus tracheiphilus IPT5 TaxID=1408161 RepID=A0A6A7BJB8_9PLEO|nr:hypothetical protein T440DRAFT_152973 [Plenodomus tracheiphilus IPT5]